MPFARLSPVARLLVLAAAAAPAFAEQPAGPRVKPILVNLVAQLDSADADQRINASQNILTSRASISLRDIESAIRGPALSPEQRQRLLAIAEQRFREEPRGAIGIGFKEDNNVTSTEIGKIIPGFPAGAVLNIGDEITSIDGESVARRVSLLPRILQHDPGDEVVLGVLRAGQPLQLRVRLGSYDALDNRPAGWPLTETIDLAWQFRSASYSKGPGAQAAPIDSGLPEQAFGGGGIASADEVAVPSRVLRAAGIRDEDEEALASGAVIGGQSRGTAQPDVFWSPTARQDGFIRFVPLPGDANAAANIVVMPPRPGANANANPRLPRTVVGEQEDVKETIRSLRRLAENHRAGIADNNRVLADPDAVESSKRLARDGNADHNAQIRRLNEQIRQLQDSLRPKR